MSLKDACYRVTVNRACGWEATHLMFSMCVAFSGLSQSFLLQKSTFKRFKKTAPHTHIEYNAFAGKCSFWSYLALELSFELQHPTLPLKFETKRCCCLICKDNPHVGGMRERASFGSACAARSHHTYSATPPITAATTLHHARKI